MKKQLLLVVAVYSIAFLTSCEQGEQFVDVTEEQEGSGKNIGDLSMLGTWYVTHNYYRVTVDGPEEMKEQYEEETSLAFTKDEAARWTFYKDGTGLMVSEVIDWYRNNDDFLWELSDSGLLMVIEWIGYYDAMRAEWYWDMDDIDILTNDKIVLSTFAKANFEYQGYTWVENRTTRLTIERFNE